MRLFNKAKDGGSESPTVFNWGRSINQNLKGLY